MVPAKILFGSPFSYKAYGSVSSVCFCTIVTLLYPCRSSSTLVYSQYISPPSTLFWIPIALQHSFILIPLLHPRRSFSPIAHSHPCPSCTFSRISIVVAPFNFHWFLHPHHSLALYRFLTLVALSDCYRSRHSCFLSLFESSPLFETGYSFIIGTPVSIQGLLFPDRR